MDAGHDAEAPGGARDQADDPGSLGGLHLRVGRVGAVGGDGAAHRGVLGGLLPEGQGGSQPQPLRPRPAALAAGQLMPRAVSAAAARMRSAEGEARG